LSDQKSRRIKLWQLLLVVALVGIGLAWLLSGVITLPSPGSRLDQHIEDLRSTNFDTVRRAQAEIKTAGTTALRRLSEVGRSSDNAQQAGLCYSLVGEIDPGTYLKLLLEVAVPGRVCTALRYPNLPAIRSLPLEQQQSLNTHLQSIAAKLSKEEAACAEPMREALSGKAVSTKPPP
jgi:hypothetical protein